MQWPALFYLRRERPLRWLGLLIYALPLTLMNMVASTRYPALAALWSAPVWLVSELGSWKYSDPAAVQTSLVQGLEGRGHPLAKRTFSI